MKISKTLTHYLFNSNTLLQTNIIITDLTSIIYANTYNNSTNYNNMPISNNLKQLVKKWNNPINYDTNLILTNNFLEIIPNEDFNYKGQMIFPLFHNNTLSGLLLFFRDSCDFITSSLKYGKTVKKFVEIFTDDNYIDSNN